MPAPEPVEKSSAAKRRRGAAIKLAVSVAFLWLILRKMDFGQLARLTREASPAHLLGSYLVMLASWAVGVTRLQILMRPMSLRLSFSRLFRITFIANYYSMILPPGIGMTVARWFKVTQNKAGRVHFAAVSLIEKWLFTFGSMLFVAIPLMARADPRIADLRRAALPAVLAMTLVGAFGLYVLSCGRAFDAVFGAIRRLSERPPLNRRPRLVRAIDNLRIFRGRTADLGLALAASILVQALTVGRIALLFGAVGAALPASTTLWAASLVFFLQVLPISLAGIGVRESLFAYVFSLYGLPPEAGVLVGLLFMGQVILNAAIGGVLEWTDRAHAIPADRAG
jgi:hypothetical protein